ncbi:MAG: polysaccharide lyase [Gemmatimonadales bacterium]|nr:polysaccharide lyase [Gemmatimonadales bacterium]
MLTLFLYCLLLGCGLQEPGPIGGTDGLEPPPGGTPGPTPTAPPPPVPPVLGDGPFPNAPADQTWSTSHDAEWSLSPVSHARYEADNGSHLGIWGDAQYVSMLDIPSAPWGAASGRAVSIKLPANMPAGNISAWVTQHRSAGSLVGPLSFAPSLSDGSIYVGLWLRHRGSGGRPYTPLGRFTRWQESNVVQKWIYFTSPGVPDSLAIAHAMVGLINADASDDTRRWMTQYYVPQFHNIRGSSGCLTTGHAAGTPLSNDWIKDEQWHLVEFLLLPNSFDAGRQPQANGVLRMWLDGRLVVEKRNVIHYCSSQAGDDGRVKWSMSSVSLEPIYGGGTNPVPYDLFLDYGRMKIMYRRR